MTTKPADRFAHLTPLQRAFLALEEVQAKLAASERAKTEPIAIVGLGCRFPGGADSPEAFWKLLCDGVDAVTEVPRERWDPAAAVAMDPENPAAASARWGAFLSGVDRFDPAFFGISPREAARLDPQQRLVLEVAHEALEDAGLAGSRLDRRRTGVFVGIYNHDYVGVQLADVRTADAYTGTGGTNSFAAGRISYLMDLQGPSMVVDTVCSSSLVSLHLACLSLRARECNVALAGGVNLMFTPEASLIISKLNALAPDGRCKAFDARANGFVRGEGGGMLALKRLSDAVKDGDSIWAVIRGSAVNQDGRSTGLTAPNALAQRELLRQALENARVEPAQVGYVEAHGTGTSLGDPIEVEALKEILGQPRPNGQACVLGSVKTNIGHLEAAAGIAGVIKAVLSLKHAAIPANLHFTQLNPRISLEDTPFVVATRLQPWPTGLERRIAGVSAFGMSGTNAHVVLEEAPVPAAVKPGVERPAQVLSLSGRTEGALRALAGRMEAHLRAHPSESLADVCHSVNVGRSHFGHRLAVVAETASKAAEQLKAFAEGTPGGWVKGEAGRAKVGFLFTGQGSQYAGMGRGLYETEPVFRQALERCAEVLKGQLEQPLLEVLLAKEGEGGLLDQTQYTQPALFALEWSLSELWKSWGVVPEVVMGHSVGEYAAACVAGVFSLEEGLKLIAARGKLMQGLKAGGGMGAVGAEEGRVREVVERYGERLAVAAVNGPQETVVSGELAAVVEVLEEFSRQAVKTRRLTVSHAFHSPLMRPMVDAFAQVAAGVKYAPPRIALVSNLTGRRMEGAPSADYWRRHVLEPVRFEEGIKTLHAEGCELFVELGPHPTLLGMAARCLPEGVGTWLPSLRKGKPDGEQLHSSLGALYVRGAEVDWAGVDRGRSRRWVRLPTYPWQRERHWLDVPPARPAVRLPQRSAGAHPLLGRKLSSPALEAAVYEVEVDVEALPFLGDHRLYGAAVLPATAYLEMATSAGRKVLRAAECVVEELVIQEALVVPEGERRIAQLVLQLRAAGEATFQLVSRAEAEEEATVWTPHATGRVRALVPLPAGAPSEQPASLAQLQARCPEALPVAELYAHLHQQGLELGPRFRGLERLWRGQGEALGEVRVPDTLATEAGDYGLHPAVLDACLQTIGGTFLGVDSADGVYVPVGLERFVARGRAGTHLWIHAALRPGSTAGQEALTGDVWMLDEAGQVLVEARGLQLKRVRREALARAGARPEALYEVSWRRQEREATGPGAGNGRWLVLADRSGVGSALVERLRARGQDCVVVRAGADDARPEELRQVLREAASTGGTPLRGVVYLWALDADELRPGAQALATGGALHLVQALAGAGLSESPRLWLVTRGAQAVERAEAPALAQAPLWGLGGTVGTEHPEWRTVRVDLAPGAREATADAEMLAAEVLQPDGEERVALRAGGRFVSRLMRVGSGPQEAAPRVSAEGSYLVTGGLGGLGLQVARWLVERGARHLVLAGRRGATLEALAAVAALEGQGAVVRVVQLDVASAEQVARVLEELKATLPPLKGVVHAAGVLEDGVLAQQRWESFERVLGPKVEGAWQLHRQTRELALDFFVLFSSAASLLGPPGQGNYAAANAFLDALAHHRRAQGLPALTLNWGPWSEVGMAAALGAQSLWETLGIQSLSPTQGLAVLETALRRDMAQVVALPAHWPTFFSRFEAGAAPRLFEALAHEAQAGGAPARDSLLARLEAAQAHERPELLNNYVRDAVARVLGTGQGSALNPKQPLREMGMDSLMAVELRNALGRGVERTLPATLAFDYPTVESITEYLARGLLSPPAPSPAQTVKAAEAPRDGFLEQVEQLSEEDAEVLLAQKLNALMTKGKRQ